MNQQYVAILSLDGEGQALVSAGGWFDDSSNNKQLIILVSPNKQKYFLTKYDIFVNFYWSYLTRKKRDSFKDLNRRRSDWKIELSHCATVYPSVYTNEQRPNRNARI